MPLRHTPYVPVAAIRRVAAPLALALLVAAAAATSGPVHADQTDPRLDDLFETLQGGELSYHEAKGIERRIWAIWMEAESGSARVLMKDGVQAMNAGDFARAEEVFTTLVELEPEFAEAWNKRATARFRLGDYQGSLSDVKKTLSLEPRHFGAMAGLGLIYDALDSPEDARKAYERALEINPYQRGIARRLEALEERAEQNRI